MFGAALSVLFVAAGVSAAPYMPDYEFDHGHHDPFFSPPHHHPYHHDRMSSEAFGDEMFDARQFWLDITRELMSIERMMKDFRDRFPAGSSTSEFVNNNYKVVIPLTGFEENEVVVKAKNSVLMVQAVQKGDIEKTYINARTLPENVDPNGTWTYDGKELVITFPLKKPTSSESDSDERTTTTEENVNKNSSREEMEPNHKEDNMDVDVGLNTKPVYPDVDREIETNEIATPSSTSSTTDSVNLGNSDEFSTHSYSVSDVEFVPIKYKK